MKTTRSANRLRAVTAIGAIAIASAAIGGAGIKTSSAPPDTRHPPIAGAEQMRRQAQAVQAFRKGQTAEAFGRFADLADDGDAGAALLALALARHGPALYGSEWSITTGQLRRWSDSALEDLQRQGPVIAEHDRGE